MVSRVLLSTGSVAAQPARDGTQAQVGTMLRPVKLVPQADGVAGCSVVRAGGGDGAGPLPRPPPAAAPLPGPATPSPPPTGPGEGEHMCQSVTIL